MKNLAHSASLHSRENIAPSKSGIKHLGTAIAELVVTLVAWTGIWYAIRWRERLRAAKGLESYSGLRLVFAAAAMLLMLFSGGCTMLVSAMVLARGGELVWDIVGTALMFGGIPFAAAIVVWFVLMARKKS